ncbi:MAG: carboxypeptidase regulatory-like domain-containing protein [Roseiflexaceae bacterium]
MSRFPRSRRTWIALTIMLLLFTLLFLATSNNATIWPVRNTLLYHATRWWETYVGPSQLAGVGALHGCVRGAGAQPLANAAVIVAERDGGLHQAQADPNGCYTITGLPAGRYVPIVSAPGYDAAAIRHWGLPARIGAGDNTELDATLVPLSLPAIRPGRMLQISAPVTLTWALPQPSLAVRRQLSYDSGGRPNQLSYLYTPVVAGDAPLPTLLAVYPGAADTWEGVSIPLAAAGYAVVAVGPAYALDLEDDIAELQRLVAFVRAGALPGADGARMALLGGSYSSLHVQILLERDSNFRGMVLLGAISDIFDMRQRFEQGTFVPPFGLDQALIALGTPNISPERPWRYSSRFHLRRGLPPILLMHSRNDEIVPFQQSEQLAADLTRLGVPHEAHFFDGLSHYLLADRPSAELTTLYDLTLAFLRRTL